MKGTLSAKEKERLAELTRDLSSRSEELRQIVPPAVSISDSQIASLKAQAETGQQKQPRKSKRGDSTLIRLTRPAEPDALVHYRDRWTTRWTNSLQAGIKIDWATRAARKCLQSPLLEFSRGKCAFCEGVLNVTSFIEIEHYQAKTVCQDLVFHWSNLFPCCSMCNRLKADVDHPGTLLKPDQEDPELLLWLHPGTGKLQPHPSLTAAQAGRVNSTIQSYDLNRGAVCVQRIDMMNFVNRWLSRVAGGLGESDECRKEWQQMTRPTTPWKFVIRHTLTVAGQATLAKIDRQIFRRQD